MVKDKVANFQVRQVRWQLPPKSWVKVNSDRSLWNNQSAAYGGIVQDHHGRFIMGFSANIGICTITMAELLGMFFGLRLVCLIGFNKAILEVSCVV